MVNNQSTTKAKDKILNSRMSKRLSKLHSKNSKNKRMKTIRTTAKMARVGWLTDRTNREVHAT